MSGRVRRDRTGSRQSQTPASPPARRSARRDVEIDPQLVPASSMPPPPTRVGRTLRSQSKEPEPQGEIARRGTRRNARERSIGSVSSNFTKATGTESYMDFVEPHGKPNSQTPPSCICCPWTKLMADPQTFQLLLRTEQVLPRSRLVLALIRRVPSRSLRTPILPQRSKLARG